MGGGERKQIMLTHCMLFFLSDLVGVWWLLEMLSIVFQSTLVKGKILAYFSFFETKIAYEVSMLL